LSNTFLLNSMDPSSLNKSTFHVRKPSTGLLNSESVNKRVNFYNILYLIYRN
jgi:hypothetical protein